MPRPFEDRKFNPADPVVVRRAFTGSGRHYAPGDAFPWKKLAVQQSRVRRLFEAGYLRHESSSLSASPDFTTAAGGATPSAPDPEPRAFSDDLDEIETMPELRAIADAVGAPYKVSKVDQREAIRDARAAKDAADDLDV